MCQITSELKATQKKNRIFISKKFSDNIFSEKGLHANPVLLNSVLEADFGQSWGFFVQKTLLHSPKNQPEHWQSVMI